MAICTQWRLTAECDQYKCTTLPLGQLWKSALWRKKGDWDSTNAMVHHKPMPGGCATSFTYCEGDYIDIDMCYHQLWGKMFTLVGWFHTIGGQCILKQRFCHKGVISSYVIFAQMRATLKTFLKLCNKIYTIKWSYFHWATSLQGTERIQNKLELSWATGGLVGVFSAEIWTYTRELTR